jgi:hypothetical protein
MVTGLGPVIGLARLNAGPRSRIRRNAGKFILLHLRLLLPASEDPKKSKTRNGNTTVYFIIKKEKKEKTRSMPVQPVVWTKPNSSINNSDLNIKLHMKFCDKLNSYQEQ